MIGFVSFLFITISNTIFTGKGMKVSPHAKLDDGKLDINEYKYCDVLLKCCNRCFKLWMVNTRSKS